MSNATSSILFGILSPINTERRESFGDASMPHTLRHARQSHGSTSHEPNSAHYSEHASDHILASVPQTPMTPSGDGGWYLEKSDRLSPQPVPGGVGSIASLHAPGVSRHVAGEASVLPRSTLGLKLEGLVVSDMVAGGPAHECGGLEVGDLLLEVDGVQINEVAHALHALRGSDQQGLVSQKHVCIYILKIQDP